MFQALADGGDERPSLAPEKEPLDLVFIEGLCGQTVIGIHASELHQPQTVTIDVCAGVPRAPACQTDCIADTIDYGELRERICVLLREHRVQLLEALAEEVARIAIDEFQAHWVRVRIAKPRKFSDTIAVGVAIERRRKPPSPASARAATLRLIGQGLVPGSR